MKSSRTRSAAACFGRVSPQRGYDVVWIAEICPGVADPVVLARGGPLTFGCDLDLPERIARGTDAPTLGLSFVVRRTRRRPPANRLRHFWNAKIWIWWAASLLSKGTRCGSGRFRPPAR